MFRVPRPFNARRRCHFIQYYPIDEKLARHAQEMNSFFSYKEGRVTAEYRRSVDEAARIAEEQKRKVDPIHHERIDRLLDIYARKLADNINKRNAIAARVPSILVAGGSNFPVRKKEKQNRADDAAMEEWRDIQGLLDKIRGTGKGGISADDPEAVQKLKLKLEGLERTQESMKAVNAYYRKHKTLEGCPGLGPVEMEKLKASMARDRHPEPKPYPSFRLTNNNAVIRQTKERIAELTKRAETDYEGWAFDGGTVEINREANRVQIHFDEKPSAEVRAALKSEGFRWAPNAGVWQRQLNDHAIRAAKNLECLRPLPQEQPVPEQAGPVQEPPQDIGDGWKFYIIPDLKTWADNAENLSPIERFASFEEAKARFLELQSQEYNGEITEPALDGRPPARLTLGLESVDGLSSADILHVRQGENYLVTDFTRSERLREDPAVSEILCRVSREIGFDLVQPPGCPPVPFEEWDNPYFPAATAGSIAAGYYDLLHECYPLPDEEPSRAEAVAEIVRFLQNGGPAKASQMKLSIASMTVKADVSEAVRKRAETLIKELARFKGHKKAPRKERKTKPQER